MKTCAILFLCCALSISTTASAYGSYGIEDNPLTEAMLRMMEVFGLIDRNHVPLGAPYLPSYGQSMPPPGLAGLQGLAGGWPGYPAMGAFPGMSPLGGLGGLPGTGLAPGGAWPGAGFANPGNIPGNWMNPGRQGQVSAQSGFLDGIWELSNGSVAVIKRSKARLFLSRERHQDFTIGYDQQHFWWTPRGGNTTSHYRYQFRDGRMVLRDNQGKMLLMRRRS